MAPVSRGALTQLPVLSVISIVSCVMYIVVFSTRGWIGSETLSLGIWTTCSWEGEKGNFKWECQATQDYVSSDQSDSWVTATQVIFVFTLLSSLLSCASIIASNTKALSMVQNPALVFVAMCAAWAAGVFGAIGILVMGIRQDTDPNFIDTSLAWSFFIAIITTMAFFLNAFFMFWKFCLLNEERISIKTRRSEARRKVLQEAQQTTSADAPRETLRGYTGTGVTHQPRPATIGGTHYRGNNSQVEETQATSQSLGTGWVQGQQATDGTQGNQLPTSTQRPDSEANPGSTPAPKPNTTLLFQVKTPKSLEESMGLKDPAKSAMMFQVATPSAEGREKEEPVDLKTPTPPSANTSQEEEEIEMDDEDFYNKMRRREEYMKRRQLFTTEEGGEDSIEQTTSPPDSPGITPQPMMPVGRLPPIQLHNKDKSMKKKKKTRERSTVDVEKPDESTMERGQMEESTFEGVKQLENPNYDEMKYEESAYEEVNILKGSTFGDVMMLEEEETPKEAKIKKHRRKRDLSQVDQEP